MTDDCGERRETLGKDQMDIRKNTISEGASVGVEEVATAEQHHVEGEAVLSLEATTFAISGRLQGCLGGSLPRDH
jgi:hypothetical protein